MPSKIEIDRRWMKRALQIARRGEGHVEPNPMVGCVITKGGRVLGEGYHRRFGGPHAEVVALDSCSKNPWSATAYITLEPCCHHGKTPPCTRALIDAGIARIVVAMKDPNPLVGGKGIRALRSAGMEVAVGLCKEQAQDLIAPYLNFLEKDKPYVIAKWAQSLDGKLATRTGDSKWISCAQSRKTVHRMRARVDGIVVGSGTVLSDDPMLTARNVPIRRTGLRIVLDARLRTPRNCKLVKTSDTFPTAIFTTKAKAQTPKADQLRRAGCEIRACRIQSKSRNSGNTPPLLSLQHVLQHLRTQNLTNLLVEGGPTLLSTFLAKRLVDEAIIFTAPSLIGTRAAPGPFETSSISRISDALKPLRVDVSRSGSDVLHRLRF